MSFFTPFVLFVLGVIIWRLQLGAKRRFEVAEQTLMAFQRASDGLSRMRDLFIYPGELAAAPVPKDDDEDAEFPRVDKREEERVRLHNAYIVRADAAAPAFGDLRGAQILAGIHFGRAAADAVDVLFRARQQVYVAIDGLHGPTRFDPDHERATAQEFSSTGSATSRCAGTFAEHRDDNDALSKQIDDAKATLESMCRPFLEDPPWLRKLSDILCRWRLA